MLLISINCLITYDSCLTAKMIFCSNIRSSATCSCTDKNFRRLMNPRKGFITAKSVYQRALPFDKPFFFEKTVKGFSSVAN